MICVDGGYLALELFYARRDLGVSTRIIYRLVYQKSGYQKCAVYMTASLNRRARSPHRSKWESMV